MIEKILKLLNSIIPLIGCYPKWAQYFFALCFFQVLIATGVFVIYYGPASKLLEQNKKNEDSSGVSNILGFGLSKPTEGEFILAPKVTIEGTGADPKEQNTMTVKTLHLDSGQEELQSGKLIVTSEKKWAYEYCTFHKSGLHEIDIVAIFGGRQLQVKRRVNLVLQNEASPESLRIQITKRYRPRFEFSILSPKDGHYLVRRLYIKYLNEYEWSRRPPAIEALMFNISYGIYLSREFQEYDLLPLTPDNLVHGFEYKGADADHFAVELYGTDVSKVTICADVFDVKKSLSLFIQSEELSIVTSSTFIPHWDRPLHVKPKRLADELEPAAYKIITALDWKELIPKFSSIALGDAHKQLTRFHSKLPEGELKEHISEVIAFIQKQLASH